MDARVHCHQRELRRGGGCTLLLHPHATHATLPSIALHCKPLSHPCHSTSRSPAGCVECRGSTLRSACVALYAPRLAGGVSQANEVDARVHRHQRELPWGGCTLLLHPHAAHATLPSLALHCTPLSHPQQRQHPPAPLRNPHTQWRLRVWRLYNTCNVQVSPTGFHRLLCRSSSSQRPV